MNMALEFEDESKSLEDYVAILRRRKKQLLLPAAITFFIVILVAILWPATYRSEATILIEEQEIPKDMVQSTITSYANQQIQTITQRIMTLKNIMGLVDKYQLYDKAELQRRSRTDIADEFRNEDVKLDLVSADVVDPRSGRPTQATIAFTLAYQHHNPLKAQKVTNELVTLYLNENLRSRTEQSAGASEFLKEQAHALAKQLEETETKLAKFKKENEGSLPELYQYNLSVIDRTERELFDNHSRLSELEKQKLKIQGQLAQISPYAATVLPTGERVLSDYDRLKALESDYRQKASVYSEDHPDVIRLKREIDALKAQLGDISEKDSSELLRTAQEKLAALKSKYTADHPKVIAQQRVVDQLLKSHNARPASGEERESKAVPDNPAYIFQKTQLESVDVEMKLLKDKTAELKKKLKQYEALVSKAPMVEKRYTELQRDYANSQAEYRDIKAKLMQAQIGLEMEQGRKGERFTLIQPPILPEDPVSPNRTAIILVGAVLSIVVGVLVVFISEALDKSIRGVKQLGEVLGAPPLISIPYIYLEEEVESKYKRLYYILGGVVAAGLIGLLLIHTLVKPLDVIWYILMRKLGLG